MAGGYVQQKIAASTQRRMMPDVARARLARLRATDTGESAGRLCLLDYVPQVSPELERPDHLAPYAEALESAIAADGNPGGICLVFAAPPQHGKTELTLRAFLWWATKYPGRRHAYVTYNEDKAESVARAFQTLAEQAGLEPQGTLAEVHLKGGTIIRFTSIGGSLTGFAIDGVCVVDDPIKGPVDARSATVRRRCVDWFDAVAWTRRHQGTSYIVMATRWHPEDLSGVLIKRGWRYINLKAIAEGAVNDNGVVEDDPLGRKFGEALWPSRKPASFFDVERKNVYWWYALYQGEPRPAGGSVFHADPPLYSELPRAGYRGAFGLDLAYSASSHADYSICVELWRVEHREVGLPDDVPSPTREKPLLYVVHVDRKQVDAPSFALTLKANKAKRPWRMRWYAAGTEKGSADFLQRQKLPIGVMPPKGDKFTRAIPVAAAWNEGRILLPDPEAFPAAAGWMADFLDVVQNFTGVKDLHDDDVDALAAAHDELCENGGIAWPSEEQARARDARSRWRGMGSRGFG